MGAIIFVPALAGMAICGFTFALFAAHYYLVVLQTTAAGAKVISWPTEPILDHFWKLFYLSWLIGLWFGPAWLIGQIYTGSSGAAWLAYAIPLAVIWLCYPVSQISSLSGPTVWLPLHPEAIERLARKPAAVLGFLGFSGITLIVLGLGIHLTFYRPGLIWLAIGSVVLVSAALMYARLLGRLAFVLMYTKSVFGRKKKKRPRPTEAAPLRSDDHAEESDHHTQPSDLPPIETPDEGPITGYDVRFDDAPRKRVKAEVVAESVEPARPRTVDPDDDDSPYGVDEPEVQPEERAPPVVVKPSADEMKLLSREDAPKPPKQVWSSEVFAFLVDPATIPVIGLLAILCTAVGGMVRIARMFNPVSGGG